MPPRFYHHVINGHVVNLFLSWRDNGITQSPCARDLLPLVRCICHVTSLLILVTLCVHANGCSRNSIGQGSVNRVAKRLNEATALALLNNDNTWHAIKWQVQLSPPVSDDPEKVRLLLDRLVANGLLTRNDTATNLLTRYISTHSNASLTQRQGSQYLELSVASVSPTRVLRIDQQGSPAFEELTRQFKDSSRQPAWVRFETGIAPTNIYALAEPLFARNLSGQTDSSWPYDMYLRGQDRAEVVYYFRRYDEIGWKIKGPLTGGDALDYDLAQGAIALKTLRRDVTESNNLAIFIIVIIAMLGIGIVAGIVVIVARRRDG